MGTVPKSKLNTRGKSHVLQYSVCSGAELGALVLAPLHLFVICAGCNDEAHSY